MATAISVRQALSPPRISTYLLALRDRPPCLDRALELYVWNGQLSAALMTPISVCEVGTDKTKLMAAMDTINARYGKGTLQVGSIGMRDQPSDWAMKQERRTPRYTTRWDEMALVRA